MSIVSPRRADPRIPIALTEAAARLLAEEGPAALSTRRLAAAVGTSTAAVYTHFGSMTDLVRAMVQEGFVRLDRCLGMVGITDDAVEDVIALGYAYRDNAREFPHLYAVMFGSSALGGFALTDEDRKHGRYTLAALINAVHRAILTGRFRDDNAQLVAQQMWITLHGLVTLDLGGYLTEPFDANTCFTAQLRSLLLGAGDEVDAVDRSLDNAWRRYVAEGSAVPNQTRGD
jgi:AcrR family transcriptional regulator